MNEHTLGTATYSLAPWQVKLGQRVGQLEGGHRYAIYFDVPLRGEPTWTVTSLGKVENGR